MAKEKSVEFGICKVCGLKYKIKQGGFRLKTLRL